MTDEFGEIEKTQVEQKSYEETQIEWRIHDFVSVIERRKKYEVYSPSFSLGDDSAFYFYINPEDDNYPEFMSLCLYGEEDERKYAVVFKFGFKRSDGNVLNFVPGILREDTYSSFEIQTIKLSEVLSRKSELVPGNVLTVTCTLRPEIALPIQSIGSNETESLKLIRLDRLSENFKHLFDEKETCDTTLKVKEKEYKVHRTVLMARSPVFNATFKHDTSEKQTGIVTIPDCDPDSFQIFLEYLYCGKLEEIPFQTAFNLFFTADKYDVPELKEFCVKYLMQYLSVENVCQVVVLADTYDETELFSSVQNCFNKNAREIFETSEWEQLMVKHHRLANRLLKDMSKVCVCQKT